MPHNMLATIFTDLKLADANNDIANQLDTALEIKALSILDKEVREVANELTEAQANLAEMTQAYELAQTKLTQVVSQIETHEGYAIEALKQNNEALARAVAEKISSLEQSHASIASMTNEHAKACEQLNHALHQNKHNLYMLKQQIDKVKATECVHKAQLANKQLINKQLVNKQLASKTSDMAHIKKPQDKAKTAKLKTGKQQTGRLRTALDAMQSMKLALPETQNSLSRAKEKHDANIQTNSESFNTEDDELLRKLANAGIASANKKAEDVLARIKSKQ